MKRHLDTASQERADPAGVKTITDNTALRGIVDQFQIPIKYIGLGEGKDDLKIFHQEEFIKSLFT